MVKKSINILPCKSVAEENIFSTVNVSSRWCCSLILHYRRAASMLQHPAFFTEISCLHFSFALFFQTVKYEVPSLAEQY